MLFCAVGLSLGGDCEGNTAEKYILRREILHPPEGNVPSINMEKVIADHMVGMI